MLDAISYKRFSSPRQAKGDSLRRQTDLAEEYCRHHDLKLIDTYLDHGLSGFTGENLSDRGSLRALLGAAKAGRFKSNMHLIVESLDRLTRQEISSAVRLFLDILDTGLVIVALGDGEQVFTKERIDNDLVAIVTAIIFLSRANNESRLKRERALRTVEAARRKARELRIPMAAQAPGWLTLIGRGDKRHFVVDAPRARVVEHIFRLAVGGMGQVVLARHLNEHRVPTFTGAARWRASMVGHLLINRRVLGFMHPQISVVENGRRRVADPQGPIEGYYPAVISEELFKQAQLAMRKRRRHSGHKVIPAHSNLMTRLGRCAVCNDSLFLSQTSDGFSYLRCVNVSERECSNRFGFPYRKLEAVLLALDRLTELIAKFRQMVKEASALTESSCGLQTRSRGDIGDVFSPM